MQRLLLRLGGGVAGLALALAACGNTKRAPDSKPSSEGGEGGEAPRPTGASGAGAGGSFGGSSGSAAQGGAISMPGDDGGAGGAADCIEGAACTCGDLTGILQCDGSSSGECSCPPAEACEAPRGTCFEPCGGDALGLWVLEETCLPGAETSGACAGASIRATSSSSELIVEVLENEPVAVRGSELVELQAQVPLSCLGIESVERCVDADFYSTPLLFNGSSAPLGCEASACGFCECSGTVWGGSGAGAAWSPGSTTLAFGAVQVPYCVEGDTMWAGGGHIAGQPKVAYKFRRRSCLGVPVPCAERSPAECAGGGDDCQPGRCVASEGGASACASLTYEESCVRESGCEWVEGGCWGTAGDRCWSSDACEATPGCSWGPPEPRCGGSRVSCYGLDVADCTAEGCSVRTCDLPDGWGGIDAAPCERLTAAACATAVGCTWSGSKCSGTTTCGAQTDPAVCAMLECIEYAEARCGGITTIPCGERSVETCRDQVGCRLEW